MPDEPFLEDFEKPQAEQRVETPIVRPEGEIFHPVEVVEESEALEDTGFVEDVAPPDPVDLSKLNKAELVAHAEGLGLDPVPDSMTKKEIIALIEGE